MTIKEHEQVSQLEEAIYNLLADFEASTKRQVKDIHVRYVCELPGGERVCLLMPDVSLFVEEENGLPK